MNTATARRRVPRTENEITADLGRLDNELEGLEAQAARADLARDAVNDRLLALRKRFAAGDGNSKAQQAMRAYESLLAVLDGDGKLSDDDFTTLSLLNRLVEPRPDAPTTKPYGHAERISRDETARGWSECIQASAKMPALLDRQTDLLDELAARLAGPGERKPFVLLTGGIYGRFENGQPKSYYPSPYTIVMLNDWELLSVGEHNVAELDEDMAEAV